MRKRWVARLQAIVSGTCRTIPTPNALPSHANAFETLLFRGQVMDSAVLVV